MGILSIIQACIVACDIFKTQFCVVQVLFYNRVEYSRCLRVIQEDILRSSLSLYHVSVPFSFHFEFHRVSTLILMLTHQVNKGRNKM